LYIRLVWLSRGFFAGLLLFLGDHRFEDKPVVFLIEAACDLLADAVELGLAANLDLVEKRLGAGWR